MYAQERKLLHGRGIAAAAAAAAAAKAAVQTPNHGSSRSSSRGFRDYSPTKQHHSHVLRAEQKVARMKTRGRWHGDKDDEDEDAINNTEDKGGTATAPRREAAGSMYVQLLL